MIRISFIVAVLLAALAAAGYWLFHVIDANRATAVGVAGSLFLVVAVFMRNEPACPGLHCDGCRRH